jgi:hypothetical protein
MMDFKSGHPTMSTSVGEQNYASVDAQADEPNIEDEHVEQNPGTELIETKRRESF